MQLQNYVHGFRAKKSAENTRRGNNWSENLLNFNWKGLNDINFHPESKPCVLWYENCSMIKCHKTVHIR